MADHNGEISRRRQMSNRKLTGVPSCFVNMLGIPSSEWRSAFRLSKSSTVGSQMMSSLKRLSRNPLKASVSYRPSWFLLTFVRAGTNTRNLPDTIIPDEDLFIDVVFVLNCCCGFFATKSGRSTTLSVYANNPRFFQGRKYHSQGHWRQRQLSSNGKDIIPADFCVESGITD